MRDLVNILKEKISEYKPVIDIDSVSIENGVYTVTTCNTYFISNHKYIFVNGVEVKIISFVKDSYFTFKFETGVLIPTTIDYIELAPFKFFYGTTVSASNEVAKIKNTSDKIPFIWLYAIYDEVNYRQNNKGYNEAKVKLFALDQCDFKNWLDIEHHNNVIVPLKEYLNGLWDFLDASDEIRSTEDVTIKGHANFGRYVKEGHIEKIFDDNLSGVQADLNIKLLKENKCCAK